MTYRVLLFSTVTPIPKYWSNFLRSFDQSEDQTRDMVFAMQEANVSYIVPGNRSMTGNYERYLDFASEEDFTMFVLRWS